MKLSVLVLALVLTNVAQAKEQFICETFKGGYAYMNIIKSLKGNRTQLLSAYVTQKKSRQEALNFCETLKGELIQPGLEWWYTEGMDAREGLDEVTSYKVYNYTFTTKGRDMWYAGGSGITFYPQAPYDPSFKKDGQYRVPPKQIE